MVATPERMRAKMPRPAEPFHLASAEFLFRFRPIDHVQNVSPAALLITAVERDVVTPEDHAVALFEKARPPKRLVRQMGITHYQAYTVNHDLLMAQFFEWYGRHLRAARLEIKSEEPAAEIVVLEGQRLAAAAATGPADA
jgi:hypothetical protein